MTKHATVYWSLCLVAATALVGGRQLVGAAPPQANAPLDERGAAVVKSEILAQGVPSVSVAVMRDGKMLLERVWGVADIEKNVSASAATLRTAAAAHLRGDAREGRAVCHAAWKRKAAAGISPGEFVRARHG